MMKMISLKFQGTKVDFLFFSGQRKNFGGNFHKHFNFEIHFAINGFYEYEFIDKKICVHKDQMLIIPPHSVHKSVEIKDDKYDFMVLTLKFSGEKEDVFYKYFNSIFSKKSLKCLQIQHEIVEKILKLYEKIDERSCLNNIYLTSCATEILYLLCNLLTDDKSQCDVIIENNVDVIIENLVNNSGFSLNDIARQINYSPRQTERLIKKLYGKNLKEIREEYK